MWPLASREVVVRAFRPQATATSEAPFRTLRRNLWASKGRKVALRRGAALEGASTIFSSLNVDAARLARRGYPVEAGRVAAAAAEMEASPLFDQLSALMLDLTPDALRRVLDGQAPSANQ